MYNKFLQVFVVITIFWGGVAVERAMACHCQDKCKNCPYPKKKNSAKCRKQCGLKSPSSEEMMIDVAPGEELDLYEGD